MTLSQQIRALLPKVTKGPYRHIGLYGQDSFIHGARKHAIASLIGGYSSCSLGHQAYANASLITLLLNHATQIADALERDEARKDDGK